MWIWRRAFKEDVTAMRQAMLGMVMKGREAMWLEKSKQRESERR